MSKIDLTRYEFVNKQARAAANVQLVTDPELTGYHAVCAAENAAVAAGLDDRDYVIFVSSFLHETLKTGLKLLEPKTTHHPAPKPKSGVPTTTDRIRELAAQGMSKGQIAKELGVKYQRVYQVLGKEGKAAAADEQAA